MQQRRMTRNMMTLASESADRFKQGKREPRRDSSSSTVPSQPLRPSFPSDGLELVRDSHC
jgi:hypothetical protein